MINSCLLSVCEALFRWTCAKIVFVFSAEVGRALGIRTLEEFGDLCLDNISKYGAVSWYDWSVQNWGTKWDAYQCSGVPEDGRLEFLTAWSQPCEVIEKLFKKHPNKKIEWQYIGEGNEFKGKVYSDGNGKVINEEEEISYEDDEEEEEE